MGVTVPLQTLEDLSKIDDPDEYITACRRMIGNNMPEPFGNRVVCAVYIENEKLGKTGKLYKTQQMVKESIWQGKVMCVLAVGPAAFKDDQFTSFYGQSVKPGDWVTSKVSATTQQEICGLSVRVIEDRFIETKINDPRIETSGRG